MFHLPWAQDFPNLGVRFGAKSEAIGAMLPSAANENHTPQGLVPPEYDFGYGYFLFDGNRK
jgi:hypothetical protein